MYGVKRVAESGKDFTIGALAAAADVHVETVRFYQRKGLVSQPRRPQGSIRRYTPTDLTRVQFIKTAQRLGFSLDEIGELLKLEDGTQCRAARAIAQRKLDDVRAKLADLHAIESALAELVVKCTAARGEVKCPLIGSLKQS
jgi:MerR family mercuric resistance operon transcriptional regulator